MKRVLTIVGVGGLVGLVAYLVFINYLSEERARRLDRALIEAEARILQLESGIEAARQEIAQLRRNQPASTRTELTSRKATLARPVGVVSGSQAEGDSNLASTALEGTTATTASLSAVERTLGAWLSYASAGSAGFTNFVRIEGTSSIHNWQVQGNLIGGSAEFGPGFPGRVGDRVRPGAIEAKVNVFIPVRSLKSVESDGRPYSDRMDEIMYDKLRAGSFNRISYTLTSLERKEQRGDSNTPAFYEAVGQLGIAGVTNTITMPVSITPNSDGKIEVAGSTQVKMSDFKISPPSPSLGGVSIKTGDEVRLNFVWSLKRVRTVAAVK